ncbi:filamentous hemagglutinin N-terminal domain-containing protein [Leptolyngbya sp. AN03gr2]|uniref:two-partner secretion domain-containing protein n=1 Tax=unclassified Leptolyngbya TaxID=2650499 RepID=UPI003D3177C4
MIHPHFLTAKIGIRIERWLPLLALWFTPVATAQIAPDNSLGLEQTQVLPALNSTIITGGAQRGTVLFHSFREFSIPTGSATLFNLAPITQTVINRVTGGAPSSINGLIQTSQPANFVFLNPAGINFGPNAFLNTGRSVLFSTAETIEFNNGERFSAINPASAPVLTINGQPSALLFGQKPGAIFNQSQSALSLNLPIELTNTDRQGLSLSTGLRLFGQFYNQPVGLQSAPGFELALIGGDIQINQGGNATSFNGRVSLGSVAGNGIVRLNPSLTRWNFAYDGAPERGSILIDRGSINASGLAGGDIDLVGNRIDIRNDATVFSGTLSSLNGGFIRFNAPTIAVTNNAVLGASTIGSGSSPSILLEGDTIQVFNSVIAGATFGIGKSPDIRIIGNRSIDISGAFNIQGRGLPGLSPGGIGNNSLLGPKGETTLNAPTIRLGNQSIIQSSVFNGGERGGDTTINAQTLELVGSAPLKVISSPLAAAPENGFQVGIFSDAVNSQLAGDININVDRLSITNGAFISSNVFATGRSGNIQINAKQSVDIEGQLPGDANFLSSVSAGVYPGAPIAPVQIINVPPDVLSILTNPTGGIPGITTTEILAPTPSVTEGGKIQINTPKLTVANSGSIVATATEIGSAGDIEINANDLRLIRGFIGADTSAGNFGSISITGDTVRLDRSLISTNSQGSSLGGNITIKADVLTAKNFTGIAATAVDNRGGNVLIQARRGLFLSLAPEPTIITATSAKGIEFTGTVQLDAPQFQLAPSNQIAPVTPSVPTVAIACPGQTAAASRLTVSGRGGLPTDSTIGGEPGWQDPRATAQSAPLSPPLDNDLDAQGWQRLPNGTIRLVTENTATTPVSRSTDRASSICPNP